MSQQQPGIVRWHLEMVAHYEGLAHLYERLGRRGPWQQCIMLARVHLKRLARIRAGL